LLLFSKRSAFFFEKKKQKTFNTGVLLMLRMVLVLAMISGMAQAADGPVRIGVVDTTFRLVGRNDRVVVDRYDDPRVDGVSCYVSRAETGGVAGSFGLATDPNRFSIACRATGKVTIRDDKLPTSEIVFGERASPFFKEIRVSRLYDQEKRVLVYLVWSTQSVGTGGSAFNSVTAVPLDR
jgi:CreA protein